jgi:hypothetical protein
MLKADNLDKTRKFDPGGRVKVKSVNGSITETFGSVQTRERELLENTLYVTTC